MQSRYFCRSCPVFLHLTSFHHPFLHFPSSSSPIPYKERHKLPWNLVSSDIKDFPITLPVFRDWSEMTIARATRRDLLRTLTPRTVLSKELQKKRYLQLSDTFLPTCRCPITGFSLENGKFASKTLLHYIVSRLYYITQFALKSTQISHSALQNLHK